MNKYLPENTVTDFLSVPSASAPDRTHTPRQCVFPPMSGLWEKNHLVENIGILR